VEAIHSFGESRLRQCVNQNSGRLVVANRRFNHRTPRLPRLTEASGFRADYGLSGQMPFSILGRLLTANSSSKVAAIKPVS
jgi:hypothetical protein